MRLDRLLTEIQLGGDFAVGFAVDDQSRDLELALGERFDAGPSAFPGRVRRWMWCPRRRSSCSAASRYRDRAAPLQFGGGGLELRYGPVAFA